MYRWVQTSFGTYQGVDINNQGFTSFDDLLDVDPAVESLLDQGSAVMLYLTCQKTFALNERKGESTKTPGEPGQPGPA